MNETGTEKSKPTQTEQSSGEDERRPSASGQPKPAESTVHDPGLPDAQGLYNPANEKDACGVGFIADMKNRKTPRHRRAGPRDPAQPRPSRRRRRRPQDGRRLRHAGADPAPLLRRGVRQARHRPARARPLRRRPPLHAARSRAAAALSRTIVEKVDRGRRPASSSAGATCRWTTATSARASKPTGAGCTGRSSSARPKGIADRGRLRAPAVHPAQGDLQHHLRHEGPAHEAGYYPVSLSCAHDRLQGHGAGRTSSATTTRTCRTRASRARSRSCTSASPPTPSRPGSSRIPTGWSRITARSTRCAAT